MKSTGQILDIDLSTWKGRILPLSNEMTTAYLGGRGLNVGYLWDHLPAGIEALDPQNILTLACGFLTGTAAPASSRLHVNALSPLTGLLGSSNVGGDFGIGLKSCGIQQLIIRGRSPQPAYLWIESARFEIRNAKSLWGLDTWETQERLGQNLGNPQLKILSIGPGGENGTRFGCIMAGRHHAAGRTGMGTVMGSKNLKAIVIKAPKRTRVLDGKRQNHEALKRYTWQIKNSPHYDEISKYGGAGYVKWADELGILATRNYRENRFEAADRIDGRKLEKNITRRRGCRRCPVQCKADLDLHQGKRKGTQAVRPEFEPLLALGAKCGLSDLETLVYLDNLCSQLGIDSISAGTVIAFAMDLYERGILSPADTGGLNLSWGNGEVMENLIRQMAEGKGFGVILAQGVRRAAQIIGRGAERYAPHVKGLEMTGYHPDKIMGTALGYTVASRGADYNDIYATLENKWLPDQAAKEFGTPQAVDLNSIHGKAALVRRAMIVGAVLDSLGLCKVPALCLICAYDLVGEAEMTAALTGRAVSVSALFRAGERIVNLERLLNFRHGARRADDRLPDMFFDKEYNSGEEPSKPSMWMEPMIKEFYSVMGWNGHGIPTEDKLAELGISASQYATQ
ncbi:MAG: aldehyde ferredoxin oxidoreductase family protein [Desulfobacterales bacterium]|nr:MAG: aldehyde ferredoxin oxidoreductase family protein [Desulfobacterales bacterium]